MSRIRQIKPSFFKDPDMAALPAAHRLFYIGLWTLADDAGYYRWDPAEVGVELYGFESRAGRERRAGEFLDALVADHKVERYDCGHIFIPTLVRHQRLSAPQKQVRTFERQHLACPRKPAETRGDPQMPADPRHGTEPVGEQVVERNGTVNGKGTGPLAPDGAGPAEGETESEFQRRVGIPAFMVVDGAA